VHYACLGKTLLTISKTLFSAKDLALISLFSALWVALNLTVAPLGFRLLGLPIMHSVITFLTLLLTVWATNKIGAASLVGIIGSTIVLLAGGPLPVIGFGLAALLFDAILTLNRHKIDLKWRRLAIAFLATLISAYFGGAINGIFILNQAPQFAVTIWAGWTTIGAAIGLAVTLPLIATLERANVKKIKTT
jgi:hypothetical protein